MDPRGARVQLLPFCSSILERERRRGRPVTAAIWSLLLKNKQGYKGYVSRTMSMTTLCWPPHLTLNLTWRQHSLISLYPQCVVLLPYTITLNDWFSFLDIFVEYVQQLSGLYTVLGVAVFITSSTTLHFFPGVCSVAAYCVNTSYFM